MKRIIKTFFECIGKNKICGDYKNCKKFVFEKNIRDNEIKNVVIYLENSNVFVGKSDDSEVKIHVYYKNIDNQEGIPIRIAMVDEKLDVKDLKKERVFECNIKIDIPAYINNLSVCAVTGNIDLCQQDLDSVLLKSKTGDILLKDSALGESDIKVMNGNVIIKKTNLNVTNINGMNGNIMLDECRLNTTKIKNQNGNITLKKCRTQIKLDCIKVISENGFVKTPKDVRHTSCGKCGKESILLYNENGNITVEIFGDEK